MLQHVTEMAVFLLSSLVAVFSFGVGSLTTCCSLYLKLNKKSKNTNNNNIKHSPCTENSESAPKQESYKNSAIKLAIVIITILVIGFYF